MKKIMVLLICTTLLSVNLTSCSYEETVITDINQYGMIWMQSEHGLGGISKLFPETVEADQVCDFVCKHKTLTIVGTRWQTKLRIKYDSAEFDKEMSRLKQLCSDSPVWDENNYFDKPAYASVWNYYGMYEYAIADEKELVITYVYLKFCNREDITIGLDCISDYYTNLDGYELPDGCRSFTIY